MFSPIFARIAGAIAALALLSASVDVWWLTAGLIVLALVVRP